MARTSPTTQNRLMTLIVGAIYTIANSLFPVIETIMQQHTRPWVQRERFAHRLSRILQQLLGLTARIRPTTLTRNPTFPTRPHPVATPPASTTPTTTPGPIRPRRPARLVSARLFSARQLALRLLVLLHQLEQLAAEAGAALPPIIHRNIARARAVAGCHALPPPATTTQTTWERAG